MKQIALMLIALQFAGCVYHRVILSPQSTEEDYSHATAMMENKQATVIFENKEKVKAEQFEFKMDSLIFVHLKTGQSGTIPLPDVNRVVARNLRPYVHNGVAYGVIPGTILGLSFVLLAGSHEDKCTDCGPIEYDWGFLLPAGAIVGAFIGGGVGAFIGASTTPVYSVEYNLEK